MGRRGVGLWWLCVALAGCDGPAGAGDAGLDAGADAAEAGAPADAGPVRGPVALSLDADPDGLFWEPLEATLYIADNTANRILAWRDDGTLRVVAELPAAAPVVGGRGLGQPVRLGDGTLVVTRLGQGTTGDVVVVAPGGAASVVPNLDPMRRRVGLAAAPDGSLYDAYFVRTSSGHVGAVARLDLSGSETDVVTALDKPVGVIVFGNELWITDQTRGGVLAADLVNPATMRQVAPVPNADLLCAGPNGAVFVSSQDGVVDRVGPDGSVVPVATGLQNPRGVAYDAVNARLFIADHDPNTADGVTNYLRVVPVD